MLGNIILNKHIYTDSDFSKRAYYENDIFHKNGRSNSLAGAPGLAEAQFGINASHQEPGISHYQTLKEHVVLVTSDDINLISIF